MSEVFIARCLSQCLSNLSGVKAAIFEEARLPGTRLRITGLASKFFAARLARKFVPIDLGRRQGAARRGLFYAALFEFLLDATRTIATRRTTANESVGKAPILLQAVLGQLIER